MLRFFPRHRLISLALAAVVGNAILFGMLTTSRADRGSHALYEFPVSVFPTPGSQVVSPSAQIAIRGIPISEFGLIVVTGSRSGVHTGRVEADSDGNGGSFIPAKSFTPGETVTVNTSLDIVGVLGGSFTYTIAQPAPAIIPVDPPAAARVTGDVLRFRSQPGLAPAAMQVLKQGTTAPGDLFVAPQAGPVMNGVEILAPNGELVWFRRVPAGDLATDFRMQTYQGKHVLTWWQGYQGPGVGVGEDLIVDSHYRFVAAVKGGNGLSADVHEFQLTPQGTALITAYYPVYEDASAEHGSHHAAVLDSVVQEIDIKTGLVLFQWDSLDHVPLSATETPPSTFGRGPFDYFHINAVDIDDDGNPVVSSRNTWAAYKINLTTGAIMWTLGGKRSTFKLSRDADFAFQHDVRIRSQNDTYVTLFDDGAGPPNIHRESRGLKLKLDSKRMTASVAAAYTHSPGLLASFEGNLQQLSNGDVLVGWGQQPYVSEYSSRGRLLFDARFVGANTSYRAYRFQWSGQPETTPNVAASTGSRPTVYVSWNGSTDVASWRVFGGSSQHSLRTVTTVRKSGFETQIRLSRTANYVAVEALDRAGHVLNRSRTVRAH